MIRIVVNRVVTWTWAVNWRFNGWSELEHWLRQVLQELEPAPCPTFLALPRNRAQWSQWYNDAAALLMSGEKAAEAAAEELLRNPGSLPLLEGGSARYLLHERLRRALVIASGLADRSYPGAEEDPLFPTSPADPKAQERRRRWLVIHCWEKSGKIRVQGGLLTSAMATQGLAWFQLAKDQQEPE